MVIQGKLLEEVGKERRNQLDLLCRQRNRAHNIDALTKGEGTLVPCKQSDGKSSPKDYQHCFACSGYLKCKSLWKHTKQCSLAHRVRRALPTKTRIQTLCVSAQPATKDMDIKAWALMKSMTQDEIAHIMKVGDKMYNWQSETASQHDVSQLCETGEIFDPRKDSDTFVRRIIFINNTFSMFLKLSKK